MIKYNDDKWMPLCFKSETNTSIAQDAAMARQTRPFNRSLEIIFQCLFLVLEIIGQLYRLRN
jgi:hypothetical protein